MNKKTLITVLAILIIPILAFFGLTTHKDSSTVAEAKGKPQIIKFSSTMCLECKEVEKVRRTINEFISCTIGGDYSTYL